MKINIKTCLGCLSLCLATAGAQADGDINDLMDCTSNLLYNRAGGFEILAELANGIQHSIKNPGDTGQIAQYARQCRSYQQMFKDAVAEEHIAYDEYVNNLDAAPATKKLFKGFISPTYNCKKAGLYGSLALVHLHWGIGADLAYCNSTLGKRWLEVRPYIDHGTGLGGYMGGGLSYGWDSNERYTSLPVSVTPRYGAEVEGAKFLGARVSSYRQLEPNTFGVSLGAGAKSVVFAGLQLNIATYPFSPSFQPMIQELSRADLDEREEP